MQPLSIELGVMDEQGTKRRILLSTVLKEPISTHALHTKLSLSVVRRNCWTNLTFDLSDLTRHCFRGRSFASLVDLSIGGGCKIRGVYTLRRAPIDDSNDFEGLSA